MTNKFFIIFGVTVFTLAFLNAFFESNKLRTPIIIQIQSPIEAREVNYISPLGNTTANAEVVESSFETEDVTVLQTFIGKVSYYSKDGCVGCNEKQIMANGEVFDENDLTLAFNKLPLNTLVRVTNTENGERAVARVTDRGGFEKYGRIADLSKALAEILEVKTDSSTIKIEELPVSTGE